MREEGIIKNIEPEIKNRIYDVYLKLTKMVQTDILTGKMEGYKHNLQGLIMNSKNIIANQIFEKIYPNPQYVSHCPAGALFGVIGSDGMVYPCEILDKPLGNLRDYDLNFMALWKNQQTTEVKKFIKDTKCNCSYECAWSINVISNPMYIPKLMNNSVKQLWTRHE